MDDERIKTGIFSEQKLVATPIDHYQQPRADKHKRDAFKEISESIDPACLDFVADWLRERHPVPKLAAEITNCMWPHIEPAYRRLDPFGWPWEAFLKRMNPFFVAALSVMKTRNNLDPHIELAKFALPRYCFYNRNTRLLSGMAAEAYEGIVDVREDVNWDLLDLYAQEGIRAWAPRLVVSFGGPDEWVRRSIEWLCGQRAEPDWFLGQQMRVATNRSDEPRMKKLSAEVLKLPKIATNAYAGKRQPVFKGTRDPMHIHAGLVSLSSQWEEDDDPLQWIARGAREAANRRIYADSKEYLNDHVVDATDLAKITACRSRFTHDPLELIANQHASVLISAKQMSPEMRDELYQRVRELMPTDAKTYFDLHYDKGLEFCNIVEVTSWNRRRTANARENMNYHLGRAAQVFRDKPLRRCGFVSGSPSPNGHLGILGVF